MSMRQVDVAIIGGGAAGMAAALGAHEAGAASILILEREGNLGGILKQCIHNGFGLHRFKEELTGPEYAARDIRAIEQIIAEKSGIEVLLDTMVLDIDAQVLSQTGAHHITAVNAQDGMIAVEAGAVILAMGARERTRGALNIAGTRPAGIYTAGAAQALVNLRGQIPGREVVMLGSGDIGLIMARRLVYEGVDVKMVLNRSSFSGGLKRNIVQCLDDYGIPLIFNRTITAVHGKDRLCGVTVSHVDPATKQPIPGTEEYVECDTLLISAGLLPENELTREAGIALDRGTGGAVVDEAFMTEKPGIFSAGNVLHVHDLVDFVSEEGEAAGRSAVEYLRAAAGNPCAAADGEKDGEQLSDADAPAPHAGACAVVPGAGVGSVVPQFITPRATGKVALRFRVKGVYNDARIVACADGEEVVRAKRRIMVPAEMETLSIKAVELIGKERLEITIEEGGA